MVKVLFATLLAADEPRTIWQRLDDATRGRVALAFAGLLLLAALMVVLIAISARMMRRIARNRPPARPREVSDWDRKAPADRPASDDDES